ncbi:hypothetical protein AVDCRST_MAG82-802, partial [uncultured Rubrobacteraceae bacterium]
GDARAVPREHAARGVARQDPGGAPGLWAVAQAPRACPGRSRLQLSLLLPFAAARTWYPAHHPRAARSAQAQAGPPRSVALLRRRPLRQAQRDRAVREQTQV